MERRLVLALDEFPSLVVGDPSLPSIIQKWFDQRRNKGVKLILCGSSTQMMEASVLRADKRESISQHVGRMFEQHVRKDIGGSRYWEPGIEFDAVVDNDDQSITIVEVKWGQCNAGERKQLDRSFRQKFASSRLARTYTLRDVRIVDRTWLSAALTADGERFLSRSRCTHQVRSSCLDWHSFGTALAQLGTRGNDGLPKPQLFISAGEQS